MLHFPIDHFAPWLLHYGSLALFLCMALGIVGLPIPDETLLVAAGGLFAHGKLHLIPTVIAAWTGSMVGISLSYALGYFAGYYLAQHYGRFIGLTPERLERTHQWFEKYGKWTLLVGYFLPGIRHLTGYVAGTTHLSYRRFALFAYAGGVIWSSIFLSIGYFSIKTFF